MNGLRLRSTYIVCRLIAALGASVMVAGPVYGMELQKLIPQHETVSLELKDWRGNSVSLAEYRGKVVIVNFWATWCEACIDEIPSLQRLRNDINQRFGPQALEVIGVNLGESLAKVRLFMQKTGVTFPVLLDRDEDAKNAWKVRFVPATFIVGTDGQIRYTYLGGADWSSPEMATRIVALIAGKD